MLPVLASASPRRAELLRAAGLAFETVVVDIDEAIRPDEAPQAYVRRLAMDKSARAQQLLANAAAAVIGADTAVVIDGEILGKPSDDRDAARMLGRLSGRRHEVMTGVSVRRGAVQLDRVEVTSVYFNVLSNEEIGWYVQSGEGRDKAGSYAIQGLASRFIPRIEGSYANVVGLPVEAVFDMLRALG